MYASFYGAFYYMMLQPHTLHLIAFSGMSLFFGVGFANYKLSSMVCVVDARLSQDGENARLVIQDGRSFLVPIKNLKFVSFNNEGRAIVRYIVEKGEHFQYGNQGGRHLKGENHNLIFDFSELLP